jgi:threonine dehydrogenase-like Zn-dependent dehydrogenase
MADRRALVIDSPGSIGLRHVDELVPGPGEVVARPAYVGVCGTDLELLAGVVDPAYVRYPLVPGHEWSGVIEAVGPGVTGLEPGQPVIAEGIIPDRVCAQCVQGHTNLCEVYDELGFTRAGAAADQVLVPAQVVHVLGAEVSLLEAALAEPAAVAWRAIGRGRPRPGERVAVVGDGTLALIAAHLLTLYSPAELVVCGQRPAQANLATELGATAFELDLADDPHPRISPATPSFPATPSSPATSFSSATPFSSATSSSPTTPFSSAISSSPATSSSPAIPSSWATPSSPGRFDLVVEAAGTAGAVERAFGLARRGGRVVLIGLAGNDVKAAFPIDDVVNNDLLISASFGYTSAAWAEVTALLRAGQISLTPLITHRFPLDEYERAYQVLRESFGPRGKVMLDVSPR